MTSTIGRDLKAPEGLATPDSRVSVPPVGSPDFFEDPYPTYRMLREQGPVVRLQANMLACTRYAPCLDLLRDARLSARRYMRPLTHYTAEQQNQLATWIRIASNQVIFMDPPQHTRLRSFLMRAFSPDAIKRLILRIETLLSELLEAIPRGTEVDFIRSVAQPFPALVIGCVLGIPRSGWEQLLRWCDVFMDFFTALPAPFELALAAQKAAVELIEYMKPIVEQRRSEPGDDLISMMLEAEGQRSEITSEEMLAQCMLLLIAGHETMRNLLGNGLYTLLCNPATMERVRRNSALVRSAVAEILRFQGPVQGITRVAMVPFQILGEPVEAGQVVIVLAAAANRDPDQFPEPDQFDIDRVNNAHLTFGAGHHTCLGNYLARLEAEIALATLLGACTRIELRDARPPWAQTVLVRGLQSLNVAFD
jgi:cytochrome P450